MKKYFLMKGDSYITTVLIKSGDSPFYPVVKVNTSDDVGKCLYFLSKKAADGILAVLLTDYSYYKCCSLHVKEF